MPKPRKKNKTFPSRSRAPSYKAKPQRAATPAEDFVGKFLLSILTGVVTALISQAVSNQVNWLLVLIIFAVSLLILALYQNRP
jgi:Flp pilus assembly protein TadB